MNKKTLSWLTLGGIIISMIGSVITNFCENEELTEKIRKEVAEQISKVETH